jgi:hypothetical protein
LAERRLARLQPKLSLSRILNESVLGCSERTNQ